MTEREEGKPAPEAWIDQEVAVALGSGGARLFGVILSEVNDRGIVLRFGEAPATPPSVTEAQPETPAWHVFYPWSEVRGIERSEGGRVSRGGPPPYGPMPGGPPFGPPHARAPYGPPPWAPHGPPARPPYGPPPRYGPPGYGPPEVPPYPPYY